jgi:CubicO group peptidase (beta-lactamase class C family)
LIASRSAASSLRTADAEMLFRDAGLASGAVLCWPELENRQVCRRFGSPNFEIGEPFCASCPHHAPANVAACNDTSEPPMPISAAFGPDKLAAVGGALVVLGFVGWWTAAWVRWSPEQALRVASAYVSRTVCSGTFVSGLPPEQVYAENVGATPAMRLLDFSLRYQVDRKQRQVTTTIAGGFASRAVFLDKLGCVMESREASPVASISNDLQAEAPGAPSSLPEIAGPAAVTPKDDAMRAALDRAFSEPDHSPHRRTKAVVIVHDGRVIAERYAPGYGVDTPMTGNSLTKSVISTLIGILVRQGRLSPDQPAPIPAWCSPDDPRHGITMDNLLRQNSGLDIDETGSGFDPVSRMLMLEPDMAGFAEAMPLAAPPGSRWRYTSGNYVILSRILRDAVGGNADAVLRFTRRELFDPLGMRAVTLEFDARGTPIGSTFMFATARDWARLGMLYLDDGIVDGHRILPEGWVQYVTSPTADSSYGYGAGWWTSLTPTGRDGKETLLPPGAFFANGRLGQFVVVVPSERLVVVRLGLTQTAGLGDDGSIPRLVSDVVIALHIK